MFVTIKYFNEEKSINEEKIVNPNVLSSVLLTHIRKTCGFESVIENIDLASESGEVIDLSSKGKEYAKKYLEPRTTYILVKVLGDESEESSQTYIPFLDPATAEKIKFFLTNPRARAGKKGKDGALKIEDNTQIPKTNKPGANSKVDSQQGSSIDSSKKVNPKSTAKK